MVWDEIKYWKKYQDSERGIVLMPLLTTFLCCVLLQVESTKTTLDSLNQRERSPLVRERPRLTLANRHNTTDNLTTYGSLGRSPTTPGADCKPKSILKKSNSNLESSSVGYVNEEHPDSPSSSGTVVWDEEEGDRGNGNQHLKPPLLHTFSYIPAFPYEQDTAL